MTAQTFYFSQAYGIKKFSHISLWNICYLLKGIMEAYTSSPLWTLGGWFFFWQEEIGFDYICRFPQFSRNVLLKVVCFSCISAVNDMLQSSGGHSKMVSLMFIMILCDLEWHVIKGMILKFHAAALLMYLAIFKWS